MKSILIIGSGAREHASAWKLGQSSGLETLYCAPGNPGMGMIAECVNIPAADVSGLVEFARTRKVDFTIVGPEGPLVAGIVDEFESVGLKVFGPSKQAAKIEGSKSFAKRLMKKYGIPTASSVEFDSYDEAREYLEHASIPIVIKADGLAAGKGVTVARTRQEALEALKMTMENRVFGDTGTRVVVEECLIVQEVSVLCLTDGRTLRILPAAQDHKSVFNHDRGPNTGGMGAYAPVPSMTSRLSERIEREILRPTIDALASEGSSYRGVLYAGLMITESGPKVIEFNCRFGDPETQAILPLIDSDLAEALVRCVEGTLDQYQLLVSKKFTVSVVLASGGYPGSYEKGRIINGLERILGPDIDL